MQIPSLTHANLRATRISSKMLQNNVSLKSAHTHIECTFLSAKHLDIDFHCYRQRKTTTAFKPQINNIFSILLPTSKNCCHNNLRQLQILCWKCDRRRTRRQNKNVNITAKRNNSCQFSLSWYDSIAENR